MVKSVASESVVCLLLVNQWLVNQWLDLEYLQKFLKKRADQFQWFPDLLWGPPLRDAGDDRRRRRDLSHSEHDRPQRCSLQLHPTNRYTCAAHCCSLMLTDTYCWLLQTSSHRSGRTSTRAPLGLCSPPPGLRTTAAAVSQPVRYAAPPAAAPAAARVARVGPGGTPLAAWVPFARPRWHARRTTM
jgi:hypothetical protein